MENNPNTGHDESSMYYYQHYSKSNLILPKVSELRRKLAEKANREPKSQRPFSPPKGMSWYSLIYNKLGVRQLKKTPRARP